MAIQGCFWDAPSYELAVGYDRLPANHVTPTSCMKQCEIFQRPYFAVRVSRTSAHRQATNLNKLQYK